MNPMISNLILMLVMMQVARQLNMEDPTVIFYIRVLYCSCTALTWIVYQYARKKIIAKNDLTTLKYVQPQSPFSAASNTGDKFCVTTVRDYDLEQIDSSIKSVYTGVLMMGFMHLYMNYTNPLLMQSISPVKAAFEHNLVQIHLFNKPAVGNLKRPFAQQSMFGQNAKSPNAADKKALEEAEKSGNGGIKSE
ncbi:probable Inorganic phosphate transport protein PHO88 [Saccharomycodes ludwigii]|uniref:Probable Inorganic phosphate transport protein PHO88 n=1 Tax=Saccharomycodes ludwigii TaxID=36035 RepID=A0A376BBJ0_9ASCO|nr:hypothetical protein SCDLUD_000570 [Saccharomycodes ludwigii]KAH3902970.1 hypothetical protein SCDLUD_000570 [Saccharomycodes ludwigii]SSD61949.1 probable Inorganic phosphate transport protein PHO88 [Saccharomycodes ludwigii]